MPPRTPVHVAFDRFGRVCGMELFRRSWYRQTDEVVTACGLQKSQYGPSYYVNVGFNFVALDPEPHPHPPDRCHLRFRIGQLIRDKKVVDELDLLLDLERDMDEDRREGRLFSTFEEWLAPVVRRSTSVKEMRAMIEDGTLPGYMLTLKARQILEIPLERSHDKA